MDTLTLFPYVGIIVLVILNALLVVKRTITVDEIEHNPKH